MLYDNALNVTFSTAKLGINLPKLLIFVISPGQVFDRGVFFLWVFFFFFYRALQYS